MEGCWKRAKVAYNATEKKREKVKFGSV